MIKKEAAGIAGTGGGWEDGQDLLQWLLFSLLVERALGDDAAGVLIENEEVARRTLKRGGGEGGRERWRD